MKNKKKEKLFIVMTMLLCLALFLQRMTGESWHAVLGVLFIIMIIVHICRKIGKLRYINFSIQLIDWMLMVDLAVVFLSGMLLHHLQGVETVKLLHKFCAVFLLTGMIVHIVQHRKNSRKDRHLS